MPMRFWQEIQILLWRKLTIIKEKGADIDKVEVFTL